MAIKIIITDTIEEFKALNSQYNLLDGFTVNEAAQATQEEPIQPPSADYEPAVEDRTINYHTGNLDAKQKAEIALGKEVYQLPLQEISDNLEIKPKTVRYWLDHYTQYGSALAYFKDCNQSALKQYNILLRQIITTHKQGSATRIRASIIHSKNHP